MSGNILFFLVFVALTVAWIEAKPKILDRVIQYPVWLVVLGVSLIASGIALLPSSWGWLSILAGIMELITVYRALVRREQRAEFLAAFIAMFKYLLAGLGTLVAGVFGATRRLVKQSGISEPMTFMATPSSASRVIGGTIAVFFFSPFAAIPAAFLTGVLLVVTNLLVGDASLLDAAAVWQETFERVIGYTFVILIVSLDVAFRWFFITVPIFICLCFVVAKRASLSVRFWKRLFQGSLLVGVVYPIVFILAEQFDLFDGPIFN